MPPKLPLPHKRRFFSSFKIVPAVRVIARQLSGKNCLASRHQDASLGPLGSRAVFSTGSDSVVFCYSVVNFLRLVIHYSKYSKSVQNVVIHYISVVNSLQVVSSLRVLFLVCWGPLRNSSPGSQGQGHYPRNIPRTPAENPLRGKFPRRASRRVVPLGW